MMTTYEVFFFILKDGAYTAGDDTREIVYLPKGKTLSSVLNEKYGKVSIHSSIEVKIRPTVMSNTPSKSSRIDSPRLLLILGIVLAGLVEWTLSGR